MYSCPSFVLLPIFRFIRFQRAYRISSDLQVVSRHNAAAHRRPHRLAPDNSLRPAGSSPARSTGRGRTGADEDRKAGDCCAAPIHRDLFVLCRFYRTRWRRRLVDGRESIGVSCGCWRADGGRSLARSVGGWIEAGRLGLIASMLVNAADHGRSMSRRRNSLCRCFRPSTVCAIFTTYINTALTESDVPAQ